MKPSLKDIGSPRAQLTRRLKAMLPQGRRKTHRLSANVTGEEDWEVDEPQIRMSRAFAVMLVLHLVAVGGLFAFHMFGRDDREAEALATRGAHESSPPPPAPATAAVAATPKAAAPSTAPTPVVPKAEVVLDEPPAENAEREHLFKSGETKMLVAAKFGITVRELEEANPDSEFKAGDKLSIPQHQRVIGALADNAGPVNPPLALIEATPSDDVGHREFALKKEDNPYQPVLPASLETDPEPERAERMAPRVKAVSAEPRENVDALTSEESEADSQVAAPAPKVKKQTAAAPVPAPAKPKPATGSRTHVVGKGDTVYNVAKRFGLSPNEIMRANGISDPSRLQMGQVLKITVKR